MARPPHLARKLALACASALVLLGAVEVSARVLGDFAGPTDPLITGVEGYFDDFRRHDPLLFWSLRPGVWGEDDQLEINSLGLRGPEIAPKAADEYRILSLGESTTFAGLFDYEECYTARLEGLLGTREGKRVRTINAGVLGYSLFQGSQYLLHRGFDLEPDAVLLYFGFNDYLPVTYLASRAAGGRRGLTDQELFESRKGLRARVHERLVEHSHAYRALRSLLLEAGPVDELPAEDVEQDETRVRVPPAHRTRLLELLTAECQARGVELVVIVPWYRKFERHAPLLRRFAEEHGLTLVDLPEILARGLPRPREEYFLDRVHPTPEGHALIARAIADVLGG
jgi:lysophospholipase L1-like esterase